MITITARVHEYSVSERGMDKLLGKTCRECHDEHERIELFWRLWREV